MSDLPIPTVSLIDSRPATTSLAIAEHFEKRHCDVMRDIANLIDQCPRDFHKRNFALMSRKVKIGNGAEREEPMYHVFFDGFILLVMGYTGKKALQMKLAYIAAFNAMREKLESGNHAAASTEITSLQDLYTLRLAQYRDLPQPERELARLRIYRRLAYNFGTSSLAKLSPEQWARAAELITAPVQNPCKIGMGRVRQAAITASGPNLDTVEAVPDFDTSRIYKDFLAYLDKIDDFQAMLGEIESSLGPSVACVHRVGLSKEKMVCVRNAQDCIQIARVNMKACEYALRSFARIRSKVNFLADGSVPIVS